MLNALYQLGIIIYGVLLALVVPFHHKAKLLRQGQKGALLYLAQHIHRDKPIVWVHAASLGEFEQGRPLIEHIKAAYPHYRVLLTFYSPSGYEVCKNYEGADYICYLPIDSRREVKLFLDLVQPSMAFFVKYEFWNNFFRALRARKIPLYMVSCIFREEQLFFKNNVIARWYRNTLSAVSHFFVQHQQSGELLDSIGLHNYTVTGDTRFDRVFAIAQQGKQLPIVEQFKNEQPLLVVGSSWQADEELLRAFIEQNPQVKVIFAPHELKENNINRLMQYGSKAVRYTKHQDAELSEAQVLIVDCMGLLSSIYKYADVAYIGGGFGVGIHNTLEAAIFNIPVLFGLNYKRFNEAVELHERGIAYPVQDAEEVTLVLMELFSDQAKRVEIGKRCQIFMNENIGATGKIVQKVINSQASEN
ncbi:MAG: 3-deoxy-D-manno-octulosonic acid transferase [Mangrovibacterium sp.]